MNFNTKEYSTSILKKIDDSIIESIGKLAPLAKNKEKNTQEQTQEEYLTLRISTLKLIKAELIRETNINYGSSLEYKNTENQEVKLLIKLANNHKEAIEGYKKVGNDKVAEKEQTELSIIEEFTPKQPTEKEIVDFTKQVIEEYLATKESNYTVSMRDMGQIVPKVKAKYPNVDGNIIRKTLIG